ncbi:hypothetical protein GTY84_27170 [Streptomyces sp. SID8352]|nr:hypothetical protein [Streptomyces sp. SID8352]
MLNRIRRALSLTRVRQASGGRHRRPPQAPSRRPVTSADRSRPVDVLPPALGRVTAEDAGAPLLAGEDIALVRPYVLAWESRVRSRTVLVAPHLPADARPLAMAGAH